MNLSRDTSLQPLGNVSASSSVKFDNPEIVQAAKDFETAFIAQMLKFSGLGEALTAGGGEDVAAFTDFYIQNFAEEISESGGFGLADQFYTKLAIKADVKSTHGEYSEKI